MPSRDRLQTPVAQTGYGTLSHVAKAEGRALQCCSAVPCAGLSSREVYVQSQRGKRRGMVRLEWNM